MGFDIPNKGSGFHDNQSEIDNVDFDILAEGIAGNGVISGCAVSAQGTPDMTLAVAAGSVRINGATVAVASGNVTITAAHASLHRFDLVVVNNAGVKSVVAGTPAAEAGDPGPVFPEIPANSVVLAAVYVPAADTAIGSTQIRDRRLMVAAAGTGASELIEDEVYDPGSKTDVLTTSTTHADVDATNLDISFIVPASGRYKVKLHANCVIATTGIIHWGVREGSTLRDEAEVGPAFAGGHPSRCTAEFILTDTPGAAKTLKMSHKSSNGNSAYTAYGGTYGPAIIEIWSMP